MRKIIMGLLFTSISLMASYAESLAQKCTACHGAVFEKAALGKSAIVYGQSASDIYSSLIGYKQGARNTAGMGPLMKGQVATMSNNDLWEVANYIASLSEQAAPSNEWTFACELSDVSFVLDKRYSFAGGTGKAGSYPGIYTDGKTIQIDRKNKTIKVWSIWLASEQERQSQTNKYANYYNNYGYFKMLNIIDYRNMRSKIISIAEYECNGNVIKTIKSDNSWEQTVPDTVMEGMTKSIMQKYNLK